MHKQLLLRPDEVLTSVRAELVEAGANPLTGSERTVHISQGRINSAKKVLVALILIPFPHHS
jgi:hypothetical protein